MRAALFFVGLFVLVASSCNGAVVERIRDDGEDGAQPTDTGRFEQSALPSPQTQLAPHPSGVTINGQSLTTDDLSWLGSAYGLEVEAGDYWYDPISGAWGYWGGPTVGFLQPYMELGYAPLNASGGGTGVVLNGRELHPVDLAGLQQLLGFIYPGSYWLDAYGNYGNDGGPAIGNLISIAQGAGSGSAYFDSTYFGNTGSDGQSSYFYDPETGCSVMSDGGLSC